MNRRSSLVMFLLVFILSACSQALANSTLIVSPSPSPTIASHPSTTTGSTPTGMPTVPSLIGTPAGAASIGTPVSTQPVGTPSGAMPTGIPAGLPNTSGSGAGQPPQYYAPLQNADYVSTGATIIVRYGPVLSQQIASQWKVSVQGTQSGNHSGKTILADDQKTLIFKPDQPFTPGEQVKAQVSSLTLAQGTTYSSLDYTFNVAQDQRLGTILSSYAPNTTPPPAFPNYLTLPKDIPHYTVNKTSTDSGEGYIFVAPLYWSESTVGSYLLILDNQGQIVYYKSMVQDQAGFDFKLLPNGLLTYYDQKAHLYYLMNNHYQVVGYYGAGDGYISDAHDIRVTKDGYVFTIIYDAEAVDMSKVVAGGNPKAYVTGVVIEELDPSRNVIFRWRSWDHFQLSDSVFGLTGPVMDLFHANSIALSNDGNLLLSCRNLGEVTKIDLQTGNIIWRLGGKNNQFKFVNDQGFAYQHDVSQLPNGDILMFDNHGTDQGPTPSRVVEYQLDTQNMIATKVWEYTHVPPIFTNYMGSAQRLPDGNTFIGWGNPVNLNRYGTGSITEVTPDNQIVFQLTFDSPYVSYRAFRFPWQGDPLTPPDLAYQQNGDELTLGYSWNGATQVASWRIYGGSSQNSLKLVDQNAKNGFETQSQFMNLPNGECYFQAAAIDKNGNEMARSKVISTDQNTCPLSP